jgi:iron complex outermembrane receptor protein
VALWGRNLFNEIDIVDIRPIESLGFDVFSVGQPSIHSRCLRASY